MCCDPPLVERLHRHVLDYPKSVTHYGGCVWLVVRRVERPHLGNRAVSEAGSSILTVDGDPDHPFVVPGAYSRTLRSRLTGEWISRKLHRYSCGPSRSHGRSPGEPAAGSGSAE